MVAEEKHESGRRVEFTIDDLLAWAASVVGSPVTRSDSSWGHDRSVVLQLRDREGARYFLKHPRDEGRFRRELNAYETVLSTFGDLVPPLLGVNLPLGCLLLGGLPGELARGNDRAADPEVHRQAGAFLARLHGSLPPEPAPHTNEWFVERRDATLRRAEGLIDAAQFDYLRRATTALIEIVEPVTVMCHLDFWQRNWLVDEQGTLRVIDFGQANRELAFRDFGLLAHRGPVRPDLQDAFFDGYGRPLDDDEQAQMDGLAVLMSVKRVLRAQKQSPVALSRARRLLAQSTARARSQ